MKLACLYASLVLALAALVVVSGLVSPWLSFWGLALFGVEMAYREYEGARQKETRFRCRSRVKSREETPKDGYGTGLRNSRSDV